MYMTQDIRDFVSPACDLLAVGEPTHLEPAFQRVRNELFGQLVEHGFRSIALETDQVAALVVNDFVQGGAGDLGDVMEEGFSHTFGRLDGNRELVVWMRDYNQDRPAEERLAFHGFDGPLETMNAPGPRTYLEYGRDFLELDLDIASLAGDDERWSRTEAVMDPAASPGDTADAERLRSIADDMLISLHARAPELIAKTSRDAWFRAHIHLTAGLGMLRYHKLAAQHLDQTPRWTRMCATRDALMAQNLLDIRLIEATRGPTLVHAQNLHLQRNMSHMRLGPMDLDWYSAGAIVASLVGARYTVVAGSLGRSADIALGEPAPTTYEAFLQREIPSWGLMRADSVSGTETRADTNPMQGYFPLDRATLDGVDAVLHLSGRPATP